jgi:hypothetical protein
LPGRILSTFGRTGGTKSNSSKIAGFGAGQQRQGKQTSGSNSTSKCFLPWSDSLALIVSKTFRKGMRSAPELSVIVSMNGRKELRFLILILFEIWQYFQRKKE